MNECIYVCMCMYVTCIPQSLKSSRACGDMPQPDTSTDLRVGMR